MSIFPLYLLPFTGSLSFLEFTLSFTICLQSSTQTGSLFPTRPPYSLHPPRSLISFDQVFTRTWRKLSVCETNCPTTLAPLPLPRHSRLSLRVTSSPWLLNVLNHQHKLLLLCFFFFFTMLSFIQFIKHFSQLSLF